MDDQILKKLTEIKCPYEKSIKILGDKYELLIIKELHLKNKPMRFNEILHNLKPLSSKTLSAKLKELLKYEIIEKEIISTMPFITNYNLTKKGKGLKKLLDVMAQWSNKWHKQEN